MKLADGTWVCSSCERPRYRSILAVYLTAHREGTPASAKQIAFLRALDLPVTQTMTRAQATDLIVRAQNARFYSWKVARQCWGRELSGRELRPILNVMLSKPGMSEEITRLIDQHLQAVVEALDASPGEGNAPAYAPDLQQDEAFQFVREELLKRFPAFRKTAAPPPTARVDIAREKEVLQQISREDSPQYYIGSEPWTSRLRPYARVAAALLVVMLVVYAWQRIRESQELQAQQQEAPIPAMPEKTVKTAEPRQKTPAPKGVVPPPKNIPARPGPVLPPPIPIPSPPAKTSEWEEPNNPAPVPPIPIPDPPPVPIPVVQPAETPESAADAEKRAEAAKILRSYKLPDGRNLQEVLGAIRAVATPKGYFLWEGQASLTQDASADSVWIIEWPVSWKMEGQNWSRIQPQWTVDKDKATLTPRNEDAKAFTTLQETLAR